MRSYYKAKSLNICTYGNCTNPTMLKRDGLNHYCYCQKHALKHSQYKRKYYEKANTPKTQQS